MQIGIRDHRFILIPSAVSRHSWNLIFDATKSAADYDDITQERFALDPRLQPWNIQGGRHAIRRSWQMRADLPAWRPNLARWTPPACSSRCRMWGQSLQHRIDPKNR